MRVAFYAPMKPPDHPVPSGDRAMARGLMAALDYAGMQVAQPCDFISREGKGDPVRQDQLLTKAKTMIPQLIARGRAEGWRAWLTYHSYYKAPDLIGPTICNALKIPYLLVEATRAKKRIGGPWDRFAKAAEAACDAADVIFYLTHRDAEALKTYRLPNQSLIHLHPFLQRETLPKSTSQHDGPMLAVGMMRAQAKLASYRLIAETLTLLQDDAPLLHIVGDGPARAEVEALFAPVQDKVRARGALSGEDLEAEYAKARLLFWPGVDEAFGMAYLEAQAQGIPVVAQDRPGVRDVLFPGNYPAPERGAEGLAKAIRQTLATPPERDQISAFVAQNHLLPAAANTLLKALRP